MGKKSFYCILLLFLSLFGCAKEGVYTQHQLEKTDLTPRLYSVNFDDGFLLALHAIELQRNWKLKYMDKDTGVIKAQTDKGDNFTVRVAYVSRYAVKIFAYADTKKGSIGAQGRLESSITRYFTQLDSHLKGFDEKSLR